MEERNDRLSLRIASVLIISVLLIATSLLGLFFRYNDIHNKLEANIKTFNEQNKYALEVAMISSNIYRYSSNLMTAEDDERKGIIEKVNHNRQLLLNDMRVVRNFNGVDSIRFDSLEAIQSKYMIANNSFLSMIDAGKLNEARSFNHDIRRPIYEQFQLTQKNFFDNLNDKTSAQSQGVSIRNFNIYWVLLGISILPWVILFLIVLFSGLKVIVGEIIGI